MYKLPVLCNNQSVIAITVTVILLLLLEIQRPGRLQNHPTHVQSKKQSIAKQYPEVV